MYHNLSISVIKYCWCNKYHDVTRYIYEHFYVITLSAKLNTYDTAGNYNIAKNEQ